MSARDYWPFGSTARPAYAQLSEEALLALMARADEAALGELYDRFGHLAYGLVLRLVGDPAAAAQIVEDAFIRLWRAAPGITPREDSARSWLLRCVHSRAVQLVREGKARPVERESAHRMLQRLDDDEREAVELAYYGALTLGEIADRLGASTEIVTQRFLGGLGRLRELLEDGIPLPEATTR